MEENGLLFGPTLKFWARCPKGVHQVPKMVAWGVQMNQFLFDNLHSGLGKVLDLRGQQHALTASNLANADTPGFKAKYIPFDRVLKEAVSTGDHMQLRRTDALHAYAPNTNTLSPEIKELDAAPWSVDGNSVVPEREAVRLTENSTIFSAVAKGLSRRMAMLKYAGNDGR